MSRFGRAQPHAPQQVASANATVGSVRTGTSDATPIIITRGAVNSGDVLIAAFCLYETSVATFTSPGWTQIFNGDTSTNDTARMYAFYKVAGASEPNTYTFTASGGTGDSEGAWGCVTLTGLDTSNLVLSAQASNTAGSLAVPGATTSVSSVGLIFLGLHMQGPLPATVTWPAGWTEVFSPIHGPGTFPGLWQIALAGNLNPPLSSGVQGSQSISLGGGPLYDVWGYQVFIGATGGQVNKNGSETGTGIDAPVSIALNGIEAGGATDTPARIGLNAAEIGTAAESASVQVFTFVSAAETAAGVDAVSRISLNGIEASSGADAINQIVATVNASQAGSGAETVPLISVGTNESPISSESPNQVGVNVTQSGTGVDSASKVDLGSTTPTGADTGTGADAVSIFATVSISDTGAGLDAPLVLAINVSENASASESATLSASVAAAETGTETDAPSLIALQRADSGATTDTANQIVLNNNESGIAVEAATQIALNAIESGSVIDQGNAVDLTGTAKTGTETGHAAEQVAISVTASAADTAAGSESAPLIAIGTAESGSGSEGAVPAANGAESAHGTEAVPLLALGSPESAAGIDLAAQVASQAGDVAQGTEGAFSGRSVADSASGSEAAPLVGVLASESASGVEGASITPLAIPIFAGDSASGVDAVSRISLAIGDSATGNETQNVQNPFPVSGDTGSGSEQVNRIGLNVSQAAAAAEAVLIAISASDSAGAVDSVLTLPATLFVNENGSVAENQIRLEVAGLRHLYGPFEVVPSPSGVKVVSEGPLEVTPSRSTDVKVIVGDRGRKKVSP